MRGVKCYAYEPKFPALLKITQDRQYMEVEPPYIVFSVHRCLFTHSKIYAWYCSSKRHVSRSEPMNESASAYVVIW